MTLYSEPISGTSIRSVRCTTALVNLGIVNLQDPVRVCTALNLTLDHDMSQGA